MSSWTSMITNRGRALQAKAQAGTALQYTRFRIGDGRLTSQSIPALTGLINPIKDSDVKRIRYSAESGSQRTLIGTDISTADLTTGFYFREFGIYAMDPDVGEILYWYGNAGDTADYITPDGAGGTIDKVFNVLVYVSTASQITANIDQSIVYVTQKEFDEAMANVKTDVVDSYTSTDKTIAPAADALRRGLDMKAFRRIPGIYNITGADDQDDAPGLRAYIEDQHAAGFPFVPIPKARVKYRLDTPFVFFQKHGLVLLGTGSGSAFRATFVEDKDAAHRGKIIQFIECNNVGAEQLQIEGPTGSRVGGSDAILFQRCNGFYADRIIVKSSAATGVFCDDSHNGKITRCFVRDTEADGIHITELSSGIEVTGNHVDNSGDDGIAAVSYKRHGSRCFDINIHHNQVRNARARGITSIGSMHVNINHNIIDGTSSCGILVHRDGNPDYDTFAPIDVSVTDNKIRNAGKHGTPIGTRNGIEIGEATNIKIVGNTVDSSMQNGIVVLDQASRVMIDGNVSDNNAGAGYTISGRYITGGKNMASGNGTQGVALLRLDKTSDTGDWIVIDNCSLNAIEADKSRDNFYAENSDGVRIGNVVSLDNRTTQVIERAIQFHNSPNIKLGAFTINKGTKPVFSGTTANIEVTPYVTDVAPTASSHAGYKIGQVLLFGAESYRWDGTTWLAIVDAMDVAVVENRLNTEMAAVKKSVNDGKILVRNTIITAKGTVADADGDGIPTHQELANGVGTILAGATADAVLDPAMLVVGYSGYDDGILKAGTLPNLTGIRIAQGAAQWGDGGLAVYPERGYQKGGPGDGEIKVTPAQLISAEPDLAARNILNGVNVFGVLGTLLPKQRFETTLNIPNQTFYPIDFGFAPSVILAMKTDSPDAAVIAMNSLVNTTGILSIHNVSNMVLLATEAQAIFAGRYEEALPNFRLPQRITVYQGNTGTIKLLAFA